MTATLPQFGQPIWVYAALAAVLVLVPILVWIAQRMGVAGAARKSRRIEVVDVLAIDTRRRILIARCDGRDAVLLIGGPADVMLGWLPAEERRHS